MSNAFDFAVETARSAFGKPLPPAPHVTVERKIGSSSYSRCYLDMFEADRLTITAADSHEVIATIEAGQWKSACQYDHNGYLDHRFVSQTPCVLEPIK